MQEFLSAKGRWLDQGSFSFFILHQRTMSYTNSMCKECGNLYPVVPHLKYIFKLKPECKHARHVETNHLRFGKCTAEKADM
jgi:hypothetical protein